MTMRKKVYKRHTVADNVDGL